jgi:hypothetical protein
LKPYLGAHVLVLVDKGWNNGSDTAPAQVVRVWTDTQVSVRVNWDGPALPPEGRSDRLTVSFFQDRAEAEATCPSQPSGAFWPPVPEYADDLQLQRM